MRINLGFLVNKLLRIVNRPALRDCDVDRSAKVGTGSNCIAVKIGRYSYMGKNCSVTNTIIGAFCSIASYCAIGGGGHPLNTVSTSPVFYKGKNIFRCNFANFRVEINKKVIIGNDVWIGEAVFINDNITIGDGVIIGAHSVVTHSIPPYAVVVGAPAKIIRYRFSENDIKKLLELKWWNWPEEKLERLGEQFLSIDKLLGEVID